MTALLIILAVIVLILVIPLGASVSYIGGELRVAARVLCFNIGILPAREPKKPKKEKPPKAQKPKKPKKKRPPDTEKPKPTVKELLGLAEIGLGALTKMRRKLVVNDFMLHLTVADDDPYSAAMLYGTVNSVLGVLLPTADRAFNVRRSDVKTCVNFETVELKADARATITLNLAKLIAVAFSAGWAIMKFKLKTDKEKALAEQAKERKDKDGTDDRNSSEQSDVGDAACQHG